MQYVELKTQLKDFTVFSLSDIRSIDSEFHRRRLNEWQQKGYIKKLIKGWYFFSDLNINENVLFEIANRIYGPSYVSLQTALSYHGLIPESVYGITSVSSRRTYLFATEAAAFSYKTVKSQLFFGYDIVEYAPGKRFKIASAEKAVLDYIYNNPQLKSEKDYAELRLNAEGFFRKVKKKILYELLDRFHSRTLTKRVESLWRFMANA